MLRRKLPAISLLLAGPLVVGVLAQAASTSARDAFWSASDMISVTPNPAARPAPKPRSSVAKHAVDATPENATVSAPGTMQTAAVTRPPSPPAEKSRLELVSENGYGAAPHLVPAGDNRLGLRYSLLLRGPDGKYTEVAPGTTFHSGDHIRLSLLSNEPGYLYVIEQGSSGTWSPLFPRAGDPADTSRVEQGKLQQVPSGTRAFGFNDQTGDEKLFVILSRAPVKDLDHIIEGLKGKPAAIPASQPADGGPILEAQNRIPDDLVQSLASRDLMLVDEQKVDEAPTAAHDGEKAVYVVSKNQGGEDTTQVVARIDLKHE